MSETINHNRRRFLGNARKFSGKYAHRVVKGGVGHNLPQEAPREFAQAVIDVDHY